MFILSCARGPSSTVVAEAIRATHSAGKQTHGSCMRARFRHSQRRPTVGDMLIRDPCRIMTGLIPIDSSCWINMHAEVGANRSASSAFRANSSVVGDPSRDLLGDPNRGSSVWSVLPSDPKGLASSAEAPPMGSLTATAAAQQTSALSVMQDAATAYDSTRMIAGSYYNHPYAAATASNYGVGPGYYQSLRSAAGFSYFPSATSSSYTATAYPSAAGFDYASYSGCYGGAAARNGYYGATGASLGSYFPSATSYPNVLSEAKSPSQVSPRGAEAKKSAGKASKKKKTPNGSATPEEFYKRVFVWDLEDVCAFSTFMLACAKEESKLTEAVKRVVAHVVSDVFGVESAEVSECEQVNIEDANLDDAMQDLGYGGASVADGGTTPPHTMRSGVDWLRKVATRYQQVREAYNRYRDESGAEWRRGGVALTPLTELGEVSAAERAQALELMEKVLGAWSARFKRCLQIVAATDADSSARVANVVLSGEGLMTSLAKLVASDLAAAVDIDNVYSTVKMTKESVLERVRTKFGKGCSFVVISMQPDTQALADQKRIPLWRIQQATDLDTLYRALSHHLL
ncbi:hypothetical protein QR680_009084 [Steinernema hermaphroditum]|uniref:Eyes absent homolog n=1 Tax=Steinernema hermaphroditum TaxID=289476 RepID=A0AA39IKE7_9BILA|nr:hypothetical protein QR680_009084 [Steinernema hermaphroditum]